MSDQSRMIVCGIVGAALLSSVCQAQSRRYLVEIEPTWSTTTHPGAFPNNAHFAPLGGAVHGPSTSLWEVGQAASPGMKRMAETGSISDLLGEVAGAGGVLAPIVRNHWFCPFETNHPSCGPLSFEIDVEPGFSRVTFASMIGPSPDWFIGVTGLDLRQNDTWLTEQVVDILPYDAGTRSNDASFDLFGPLNSPPEPITLITAGSPQVITGASLGVMRFTLVPLPCPADLDGGGSVGTGDLAVLLAGWGQPGETDISRDGVTDAGDLAVLLSSWGVCE